MKFLVVSSCTSRKRAPVRVGDDSLRVSSLRNGGYESVARQWKDLVSASEVKHHASLLYCGRTVTDANKATEAVSGQLAFVSAGMGVVLDVRKSSKGDEEKIPSYSLTVSPGNPDSVERVIGKNFLSVKWWLALTKALGTSDRLKHLIEDRSCHLAFLAMPASYIEMVSGELKALSSKDLGKLRIFGPRRISDVPKFLQSAVMPYDERLNSKKIGMAGTESDFAQRALLHFVTKIFPSYKSANQSEHAAVVVKFLAPYSYERKKIGIKLNDKEIIKLVRKLVKELGLGQGKMLRHLRDNEGIACEQTRFRKIFLTVSRSKKCKKNLKTF